ncbi:MAG: phosphoribosyltransferase family protein [Verrucomicrobiota bacterium]
MLFADRVEAGQLLARAIKEQDPWLEGAEDVLVLAIPRGGVVVGAEIARELHAPLDVWLAHKLGAPANPEFAIGSVSVHGEVLLDRNTIQALGVGADYIQREIAAQQQALRQRMLAFRGHDQPVVVEGKNVVLVDDGVATGATAFSALSSLKRAGASQRIFAAPVAPLDIMPRLRAAADRVIILDASPNFAAVGQFYSRFEQVSDEEVVRYLAEGVEKGRRGDAERGA